MFLNPLTKSNVILYLKQLDNCKSCSNYNLFIFNELKSHYEKIRTRIDCFSLLGVVSSVDIILSEFFEIGTIQNNFLFSNLCYRKRIEQFFRYFE